MTESVKPQESIQKSVEIKKLNLRFNCRVVKISCEKVHMYFQRGKRMAEFSITGFAGFHNSEKMLFSDLRI